MPFGWAGAAKGASDVLGELLAERALAAQRQQDEAARQQQFALQQQQITAQQAQFEAQQAQRAQERTDLIAQTMMERSSGGFAPAQAFEGSFAEGLFQQAGTDPSDTVSMPTLDRMGERVIDTGQREVDFSLGRQETPMVRVAPEGMVYVPPSAAQVSAAAEEKQRQAEAAANRAFQERQFVSTEAFNEARLALDEARINAEGQRAFHDTVLKINTALDAAITSAISRYYTQDELGSLIPLQAGAPSREALINGAVNQILAIHRDLWPGPDGESGLRTHLEELAARYQGDEQIIIKDIKDSIDEEVDPWTGGANITYPVVDEDLRRWGGTLASSRWPEIVTGEPLLPIVKRTQDIRLAPADFQPRRDIP